MLIHLDNAVTDTVTSVSMVTEYINEVKRVTESYADVFDMILEGSGLVEVSVSLSNGTMLWEFSIV